MFIFARLFYQSSFSNWLFDAIPSGLEYNTDSGETEAVPGRLQKIAQVILSIVVACFAGTAVSIFIPGRETVLLMVALVLAAALWVFLEIARPMAERHFLTLQHAWLSRYISYAMIATCFAVALLSVLGWR